MKRLSLSAAWTLIALAPFALRVLIMPVAPHDFWWHMAQGRAIVGSGRVPTLDAFSWTRAGTAFFDQSWLAQIAFYELHARGGVELVVFAQTLCVLLAYALTLWLTAKRANDARVAALLLLVFALPMSLDNWQIRPQTFALPFFALTLAILTAWRERWLNVLWLLPPLLLIWANLHGSFEQGLALMALTIVGEIVKPATKAEGRLPFGAGHAAREAAAFADAMEMSGVGAGRRFTTKLCPAPTSVAGLLFWSALAFLATFLNPRGAKLYFYIHDVLRHPSTHFSGEWRAPSFNEFTSVWFWMCVGVAALFVAWKRPRLPLTDWLWLFVFLLVAMKSGRSVMWFALVAMPTFGAMFANLQSQKPSVQVQVQSPTRVQSAMNIMLVGAAWLPVVLALPWLKPKLGLPPQIGALLDAATPVASARFLANIPKSQRPRRLYANEGAGSYLTWTRQKVWIDTRFELYPPQQWRDHLDFKQARSVSQVLRKYDFDGALLARDENALKRELLKRGWRSLYADKDWTLLRKSAAN